jgi:serine/threonine protein kinase
MIETVPSGTVLHGRYRIERVLGSGGFGHVYLAVDLISNLQCAVKEYLVTGTSGQEQLQHEATVLSHLQHKNLPSFQDAFMERGRYYIVLSYIEGQDLTDLIRTVRQRNEIIPIPQIINWLQAICDAVTFLHCQQPIIIHRDIKPDNIRITPVGTAVLVDLGNAKAAADGARTLFFIRHQGTPGYAPPEQYPGGSGTDARSDVYALGATLFFALTTHEPPSVSVRNQSIQQGLPTLPSLQEYLQKNPPEEGPEALAARQQFRLGITKPSKPAPRHSRHIAQLGTLPSQLLAQLNAIIQKSMALNPNSRYQHVTDFLQGLREVALALSPSPIPPTPPQPPADPHATQPELHEVPQEAKEQASRDSGEASPGSQPTPPSSPANTTCSRCGKSLAPKAVFCPQCGTAVAGKANPPKSNQQAQMHNESLRDIAAEETQLIPPKAMQEAIANYQARGAQAKTMATPSSPYTFSQHQQQNLASSNDGQSHLPPQPAAPQAIGYSGSAPGLQQVPQAKQQQSTQSSQFKPGMLIASAILALVLLAIILFIIANH